MPTSPTSPMKKGRRSSLLATGSYRLHDGAYEGFTDAGEQFLVPETLDTVATLIPYNWSITSVLTLSLVFLNVYCIAFMQWSKWPHVFYFLFFRCCYDIGLGGILRSQSEHKTFFLWYESTLRRVGGVKSRHWIARLFHHLAASQIASSPSASSPPIDIDSYPSAFRAWLVYKNLVNVILINDGLNYLLLGVKCFHFPTEPLSLLTLLQYALGVFLAVFNWWAKVDAHRCIGEYCWYWGDFFFRKEMTLTFDGIFELFPHPMYTVGYSLYYGYSLICRSYTMLFVSIIAHSMQLTFLFVVEEPHIERLYGSHAQSSSSSAAWKMLYDPKEGLFPAKRENVLFAHLDLFRSGDFALVIVSLYGVLLSYYGHNWLLILQVIVWRCIHWIGGGIVLWQQGKRELWTRHFTQQGRELQEAFGHWKRTYNLSLTMNFIVFITCAIRYFTFTWMDVLNGWKMACLVLGLALIMLSIWSFKSTYDAVGDFGWFYGDFFVSERYYKSSICYTGIYRFLNNPDCVTGYAGQYGLALICQSWVIFTLAAFSHICHIIFLNLVEIPHMHKLYSETELRGEGPLPRALAKVTRRVSKTIVPSPVRLAQKRMEAELRKDLRKIRVDALQKMFELYQTMDGIRGKREGEERKGELKEPIQEVKDEGEEEVETDDGSDEGEDEESSHSRGNSGDLSLSPGSTMTVTGSRMSRSRGGVRYGVTVPPQGKVGQPITVEYTSDPNHSDTDWIGIYPIRVPSGPGHSEGRWLYVPVGSGGTLTFPPALCPKTDGVYEVRYHTNNRYTVRAAAPIILTHQQPTQRE